MKVANLIKIGIAARGRWCGISEKTQVLIAPSNYHVFALPIMPSLDYPDVQDEPVICWGIDEEHVSLDHIVVAGERARIGYGPKTDTLVVADPD